MSDTHLDLLITGGLVLSLDEGVGTIENGAVAVAGDRIAAIGPADDFSNASATRVLDARGGIIMPGLINTHTHAAMTLFRGLADDLPLMNWLEDHIFPAEAKLTDEAVYWGSLLACAEMIRSGTTCFCDMYLFEDAVARAAADAGMRAVVGEVLFDFPSPNYGPIENGFAYSESLIEKWADHPLVTVAVEPHSPYLCAPELLQRAADLAKRHRLPLVMHLSETRSEVKQILEKYGKTPVQHLADLGVLSDNLIADHCVVLSDEDMDLLKTCDVKVSHNPESNMKLASGIAPVPALLERGICVGLGTDGCASNNDLDLFSEMDTAAKLHKVTTFDPTATDAGTVLAMATTSGARALGLGDAIGSLAPGKKADIIIIDTGKPHLTPMYNPVSHLVYSVRGNDVASTVIDGRVVMEEGRLCTIDPGLVLEKTAAIARDIAGGRP
jgi:5-methylthioadenosine/S-adenosylhomocysteine deaminase